MNAGEYIIDLRETFPDVWEPSIEQQFSDDVKAAISGCAKSDPFAASFADSIMVPFSSMSTGTTSSSVSQMFVLPYSSVCVAL